MFEPKVRNEQTDLLVEAILKLQSKEDAYRFFEDVCTIAEMKSMAQRIEVARMLRSRVTYQEIAKETGVQGRVVVGFVVERDGSITDVKVLRSVDPSLDREAMRVEIGRAHV